MKIIDARKLNCPQPLILTKNALEGGEEKITTIVDNDTAKINVIKYCNKMGYFSEIKDENDGIYINISKSDTEVCAEEITKNVEAHKQNKGYMIGTNILGSGSEELGKMLMKGFIYTITQSKPYPDFMVFVNSGVKLTSEGSDSLDDLNELLQHGTRIVSCGTCLDYYKLKEKLMVGEVTNMYDIVETISASDNVITIG